MVAVPLPTMVTVLPLTVATAGFELVYVTGNPEVAVAPRVIGASPTFTTESDPKLIDCVALVMVKVLLLVPELNGSVIVATTA